MRVTVSPRCARPCPSCAACDPNRPTPSLAEVLRAIDAVSDDPEVVLGGGDATAWVYLDALLASPQVAGRRIWVEAPAAAFRPEVLRRLAAAKATGIGVQIEATGPAMALLG